MPGPTDSCSPHRVLYVEDHAVHALLMAAVFERRSDLHLVVARSGQQALCLASALHPSLMLLDMQLPDCRGSDLLPLLRQMPGCDSAPAVLVTASDVPWPQSLGFDDFWSKPLDVQHVLQRLRAWLPPAAGAAPSDNTRASLLPNDPAALAVATIPFQAWRANPPTSRRSP